MGVCIYIMCIYFRHSHFFLSKTVFFTTFFQVKLLLRQLCTLFNLPLPMECTNLDSDSSSSSGCSTGKKARERSKARLFQRYQVPKMSLKKTSKIRQKNWIGNFKLHC